MPQSACTLCPVKDSHNERNKYGHNFEGRYCVCDTPWDGQEEMTQCCVCEDWFHERCLDVKCPEDVRQLDEAAEGGRCLICRDCASDEQRWAVLAPYIQRTRVERQAMREATHKAVASSSSSSSSPPAATNTTPPTDIPNKRRNLGAPSPPSSSSSSSAAAAASAAASANLPPTVCTRLTLDPDDTPPASSIWLTTDEVDTFCSCSGCRATYDDLGLGSLFHASEDEVQAAKILLKGNEDGERDEDEELEPEFDVEQQGLKQLRTVPVSQAIRLVQGMNALRAMLQQGLESIANASPEGTVVTPEAVQEHIFDKFGGKQG